MNDTILIAAEDPDTSGELTRTLEAADYAGPLLYEVPLAAPDSIRRPRPLVPADFALNRAALAEKRVPPPFGVPDEAVCRESGWTR